MKKRNDNEGVDKCVKAYLKLDYFEFSKASKSRIAADDKLRG